MKTLSKNQVTALHSALIREFGGIDGIRDEGRWNPHWPRRFKRSAESRCIRLCRPKRHSLALA